MRGVRHDWTTEDDAILGTMTDGEVAARIGVSTQSVLHRRAKLGVPPYWRARAGEPEAGQRAIPVDDVLRAKLDELAPLLAERFRAQGLPVRTLEHWQVIEWCVHHALSAARRERTKQLYGPSGPGGQGNGQQKDEDGPPATTPSAMR